MSLVLARLRAALIHHIIEVHGAGYSFPPLRVHICRYSTRLVPYTRAARLSPFTSRPSRPLFFGNLF